MFNHLYLTLGEALTGVSFLGLLAGTVIGIFIMMHWCDRHADEDYNEGKVDGYNACLGRLFDGTLYAAAAPAPVELEPDADAWAAELAAINASVRAPQMAPAAPPGAPVDGESTFVGALLTAPISRVGDVFDGWRPSTSWARVHVRGLLDRAAGRRP